MTPLPHSGKIIRPRSPQFGLSILGRLQHNFHMENNTGPAVGLQALLQWAMTPPQAYAVYFVCLVLIGGLSFYAGTLNPKKAPAPPPATVSAPRG
jgi:hypothetical protein